MTRRLLFVTFLIALVPVITFAQTFSAILTGANEVPTPGDPDGSGIAVVTISGTTIRYTLFVQNIAAPTGAHIHRGAAGVANPPLVSLTAPFSGGGSVGEVTGVEQALINEILANPSGFYVNVHTSDFPQGAIRGQLAAPPTGPAARTLYVPVVGKVAGAAGTNFVTDLRVINQSGSTANVTLDYFQASPSGQSAPSATKSVTIAPGEQKVLDDVIGFLGATSLGGLRITSDQNIDVRTRVINDLRGSGLGTTGFSVGAEDSTTATTSGTLAFLSQSSLADIGTGVGFRTNIGYFNPSASPVSATFTVRRTTDGAVLGTASVNIPSYGFAQQGVFSLVSSVAAADQVQPNFYVTWTSSAPLFVYGSVVDNKTGDSVLIQ